MVSLEASFRHCAEVTQKRAKNFYFGIKLLPSERRNALCAVYAFFRYCDDVSDEGGSDRARLLARWKEAVDPESGVEDPSPILPAFHDTVRRYGIPTRYFLELIEGTEMDLVKDRYANFDELYGYCYRVASTVGLVCIHIFGFDGSPEALQEAEYRGIAFQLTNILRDVAEDVGLGRIYLPQDELARFGVTEAALLAGKPEPEFAAFIEFQVARARDYYVRSEPLFDRIEGVSRPSLAAMTRIYRELLEKIARLGPKVITTRAQLTKLEKLKLAGETLLGAR